MTLLYKTKPKKRRWPLLNVDFEKNPLIPRLFFFLGGLGLGFLIAQIFHFSLLHPLG